MFEQSIVQARALAGRPWTMAVSVAAQGFFISAAVLIPLLHPDGLQRVSFWIPVAGPPRAYRPPAAKLDVVRSRTLRPVFHAGGLIEPARVPQEIRMLQDDPGPAIAGAASGPCLGCVVGGLDVPDPASGVINQLAEPQPLPPPKPAAKSQRQDPQPALPRAPVKVSSGVQAAKLIHGPAPLYPPLARQARISGTVHLSALINTAGRIAGLRAIGGHPLLINAALDAVKRWIYKPTLLNGEPVEVVTEIAVTFTLN